MLVVMVLASALLHAAWNALLARHPDPRRAGVSVVAIAAVVAAVAALIEGERFATRRALVASLAAGVFEAGYFACLARGLAAGALAPVYTISRGGAVVLVWPIKVALDGGAPAAVFAVALAVAAPAQALVSGVRPRGVLARGTLVAGVLCAASFVLFLAALGDAGAGAVLVLRNTSIVFAAGFGALLGEPATARQLGGAVLVAAGAALVGLA